MQKASPQLRHLANEVGRRDAAALKKDEMLTGRSISRIIAVHVTTREDPGQVYTYQDSMAITILGEGKAADADLCRFYDEWAQITQAMDRPTSHSGLRSKNIFMSSTRSALAWR